MVQLEVRRAYSDTAAMVRFDRKSRFWLGVVCILLVASRVTGAHLHLCLDGSEPPAALHFDDAESPHHLGSGSAHHDVDVKLAADTLYKKFDAHFDLSNLLVVFMAIVLFLPVIRTIVFDGRTFALPSVIPFYLRPPLRGPPVSSHR